MEWLKKRRVDLDISYRIQVRQGKGRKNRVVPLVGQALDALKAYLAVREVSPEYDNVFLARNKTSMDQRTVRLPDPEVLQRGGDQKKGLSPILYDTRSQRIRSITA
jgi:site-specific recombinase XerC